MRITVVLGLLSGCTPKVADSPAADSSVEPPAQQLSDCTVVETYESSLGGASSTTLQYVSADGWLEMRGTSVLELFFTGLLWDSYTYDVEGDGLIESRTEFERDAGGLIIRQRFDQPPFDDTSVQWANYVYSYADNQPIRGEYDYDANGHNDAIVLWTWDPKGLASVTRDDDADGVTDYAIHYIRDEVGNVVRTDVDADNDGSADEVRTCMWSSDGALLERRIDVGDGEFSELQNWEYDEYGNVTEIRTCDDTYETDGCSSSTYVYNEQRKCDIWDLEIDFGGYVGPMLPSC